MYFAYSCSEISKLFWPDQDLGFVRVFFPPLAGAIQPILRLCSTSLVSERVAVELFLLRWKAVSNFDDPCAGRGY